MRPLAKTLESKVRIQYQDCDPFNHLNNSRYIDYIMAARTEQLVEHYHFNTSEYAYGKNIGWVSAQTQVSYFYPASWMELVTIETRLIQFSESSLLFEGLMWDEHKSKLKAVMWAKLVHFNLETQRSFRHSADLMNLFQEIHDPVEYGNFDERVGGLRRVAAAG
ncbi:acyl-CoA thioesterase [Daejeonella lutea]|uniref:Acyl-CoA thioester hydrolase n=1 Tax=Daejeonella lutea TaxID=572036 RepID=A0A1T5AYN3_9SPHI|nr:acyl-CoA thioesterase [Daejeonella lutea]SKB40095.1 acyl-CoA thioester hydrolase [Daejeonella lutea]